MTNGRFSLSDDITPDTGLSAGRGTDQYSGLKDAGFKPISPTPPQPSAILPTMCESKVILAGAIEIPFISWTANFAAEGPSSLSVVVEPSIEIEKFIPSTPVQLWVRDPHVDPANKYSYGNFYLLFEGSYRSRSRNRTGTSAAYTLVFHGTLQNIGESSPMALALEDYGYLPVFGGYIPAEKDSDIITLGLFSNSLFKENMSWGLNEFMFKLTSQWSFMNLLFLLKMKFFHHVKAFDNRFFNEMVRLGMTEQLMGANTSLGSNQSVLGILQGLLNKVLYKISQTPFPTRNVTSGANETISPEDSKIRELYKNKNILRTRNELLLLPDLFLSIMPKCNIVHKKCIRSISDTEDFYTQPTRKVIRTSVLKTGIVVTSPNHLFPGTNQLTGDRGGKGKVINGKLYDTVYTGVTGYSKLSDMEKLFIRQLGNTNYKLKGPTRPIEILKGIIPSMGAPLSNEMAAFVSGIKKPKGNAEDDDVSSEKKESYFKLIQELAEFTRVKEANAINVQASLDAHFWIVPGLPALICDEDIPMYGIVDGVTISMDRNGGHSIDVSMTDCFKIVKSSQDDPFDKSLYDQERDLSINWNSELANPASANKFYTDLGLGTPNKDVDNLMKHNYNPKNLMKTFSDYAEFINNLNVNIFLKQAAKKTNLVSMTDVYSSIKDLEDRFYTETFGDDNFTFKRPFVTLDMEDELIKIIDNYMGEVMPEYYKLYTKMEERVRAYVNDIVDRNTKIYGEEF